MGGESSKEQQQQNVQVGSHQWLRNAGFGVSQSPAAGGGRSSHSGDSSKGKGSGAAGGGGGTGTGGAGGGDMHFVTPLEEASVVDSSRNRTLPFNSSAPSSMQGSDRSSVSSRSSSISSQSSSRSSSFRFTNGNGNGNGGNGGNGNGNGGGGGGASMPGVITEQTLVPGIASPTTTGFAMREGAIANLPAFGFTNNCGVSGWGSLADVSLDDEFEAAVQLQLQQQQEQQGAAGSSSTPLKNQGKPAPLLNVSTSPASLEMGGGGGPRLGGLRNQTQVSVLTSPSVKVLSAVQPLAETAAAAAASAVSAMSPSALSPASHLKNTIGTMARSPSSKQVPSFKRSPSGGSGGGSGGDSPSGDFTLTTEMHKKLEAASRCRYGVPTNYTMASVGSQPRPIRCVCSTADGHQYVVVATETNAARLIDPERQGISGSSVLDYRTVGEEIIAFAVSRDGRFIVTSGSDSTVVAWDLSNGKKVREIAAASPVRAIALSDDGELVAGTIGEDAIAVWETKSGDPLSNCGIHSAPPTAVGLSRRGIMAASGASSGEVCVWQCPSGAVTFRFYANRKPIRAVSFSNDSSRLVAVDQDSVRIWDTFTGELIVSRFPDDSISLGEEEAISLANGSFVSATSSSGAGGGGGGSSSSSSKTPGAGATAADAGGDPLSDAMASGSKDAASSSSASSRPTSEKLKQLNGSFGNKPVDDDAGTARPSDDPPARTPAIDPMDHVFVKNAKPAFTCGTFAACNVVVVGTNVGLVLLLEPNTGTELLSLSCRSGVRSVAASWTGDTVFIGDNTGNVYKLKLQFSAKAMADFNMGLRSMNDNKRRIVD